MRAQPGEVIEVPEPEPPEEVEVEAAEVTDEEPIVAAEPNAEDEEAVDDVGELEEAEKPSADDPRMRYKV